MISSAGSGNGYKGVDVCNGPGLRLIGSSVSREDGFGEEEREIGSELGGDVSSAAAFLV